MKRPVVAIALILLLLGVPATLWTWEKFRPQHAAKPRSFLQALLSPVARFAAWGSDSIASGLERFVTAGMVRDKNAILEQQVARLGAENSALREELLKWQRLQPGVDMAVTAGWTYVAADVIGFGERHWMGSLLVNRGSDDGIRVGDPAIYMQGLAGVVVRVAGSTATIHLLNDPQVAVFATVLPVRARGLVRGTGRSDVPMEITMEDPSMELRPGDRVITSGLGDSLYPRGLNIGTIAGLGKNRFGQPLGQIKPAVDFGHIEEVLILLGGRKTSADSSSETTGTLLNAPPSGNRPLDPAPALPEPALPTTESLPSASGGE